MDAYEYLSNLPEEFMVAVNYNMVNGDVVKTNGMAVNTGPPYLEIRFSPDSRLDPKEVDIESDCMVFIETGEIVTLICTIKEISGKNILHLKVRDLIQNVEKRQYFRSPAHRLSIRWYWKNSPADNGFKAKAVNISSGGMLVAMDRHTHKKDRLVFEIKLPEPVEKTIRAEATVLRVEKQASGMLMAAIMFENIDEICDDIMKYCFAEQRRLLREKVDTKDLP